MCLAMSALIMWIAMYLYHSDKLSIYTNVHPDTLQHRHITSHVYASNVDSHVSIPFGQAIYIY